MAKDIIGSLPRALVGIPVDRLGLVLDIANRLNERMSTGDAWYAYLSEAIQKGLPAESPPQPLFKPVGKVITLHASPATPTAECFTDQLRYWGRDGNLDKWLPTIQQAQSEKEFQSQALTSGASFMEMLKEIFKTDGTLASYSKLIIASDHTVALPQIDALIKRQESGEDVGLKTNGNANFFFVLNKDGYVSVVLARRRDGQWFVGVHRLDNGGRWDAESRMFLRNS